MASVSSRRGDFDSARAYVQIAKDQMAGQPQFTDRALIADGVLVMTMWFSGDRAAALALCADLRSRIAGPTGDDPMREHVVALVRSATGYIAAGSGDIVEAATDLRMSYPAIVLVTADLRRALGERFTEKYAEGKGLATPRAVAALAPQRLRSAIRRYGAETGSVEEVDDGLPVGLG